MIKEMESMSCEERLMDRARDSEVAGEGPHAGEPMRDSHGRPRGSFLRTYRAPKPRQSAEREGEHARLDRRQTPRASVPAIRAQILHFRVMDAHRARVCVWAGRTTSVHSVEYGTVGHPATMESQAWHLSGGEQGARQPKDPVIWKHDVNPRASSVPLVRACGSDI